MDAVVACSLIADTPMCLRNARLMLGIANAKTLTGHGHVKMAKRYLRDPTKAARGLGSKGLPVYNSLLYVGIYIL